MNSPRQQAALERIAASGASHVIGIDEVGLGPCAGPLVLGGAVLPRVWNHEGVMDSKGFSGKNKEAKRFEVLEKVIRPQAAFLITAQASNNLVDTWGREVVWSHLAQQIATSCVAMYPDSIVVVDGNTPILISNPVIYFSKADELVPEVGAASILAKHHRDAQMIEHAKRWPQYGWEKNKGYPTKAHKAALIEHGPCELHRMRDKPVMQALRERQGRVVPEARMRNMFSGVH